MDPVSLRVFVSTVEEGTVAAAAKREHLAAAAVSKRISELEALLRTPLLKRTNKGVEPTAAGLTLLGLARHALDELNQVQVQMRDFASGVRGHVRVFANLSAIAQFLPQELRRFLLDHPQVQIHLEERISSAVVRAVAEHAADIGIFAIRGPHASGLQTFAYQRDRLVLLVPANHPLARHRSVRFQQCLDFDFVGLHTGSAINLQLFDAARQFDRVPKLRIQVTSYEALGRMVHAGLGIGVIPSELAKHYVKTLDTRALKLEEPWADRDLLIGVRSFESLPLAARRLVWHLRGMNAADEPSTPHR